jgi:acetylornithine deacetylase/succinyl-diaminopimelate desuccinylase-like protein
MVFIPCRDGISHSPAESASPADAAGAIEVMLGAVAELSAGTSFVEIPGGPPSDPR